MITVQMDLNVHGLGKKITQLSRMTITNLGTGTDSRRNYKICFYSKNDRLVKTAVLTGWASKRHSPVKLLQAAINAGYPA